MPKYTNDASNLSADLIQDALPPPNIQRWLVSHKVQVIHAVRAGIITLEDACRQYALSVEEFIQWQNLANRQTLPILSRKTKRSMHNFR